MNSVNAPVELDRDDPTVNRPYYRLLGVRAEAGQPAGHSRIHFSSRLDFENSRGDVHGGVIASLLDVAMSVATRSACTDGEGATTVTMTVNYLEAGRDRLVATGHTVRSGRTLASVEASVVDDEGRVVAHAIGTMRIIGRRKQ
jgi:uncharacterized protein (TIGR00369 family)